MSTTPRLPPVTADTGANLGSVLAHAPAIMQKFGALYAQFWQQGDLSPALKEMTRIRNARITDCGY